MPYHKTPPWSTMTFSMHAHTDCEKDCSRIMGGSPSTSARPRHWPWNPCLCMKFFAKRFQSSTALACFWFLTVGSHATMRGNPKKTPNSTPGFAYSRRRFAEDGGCCMVATTKKVNALDAPSANVSDATRYNSKDVWPKARKDLNQNGDGNQSLFFDMRTK